MQESIETLRTELEEGLRFETFLAETSARFVNLPTNQIDGEIEGAQRRICELLDLDRSALWQVPEREPEALLLNQVHCDRSVISWRRASIWFVELRCHAGRKGLAGNGRVGTKLCCL